MANSFLIGPITSGLKTDVKPWLLPEDAFERLQNAYLYEGRIRKRFGSTYTGTGGQLFSRLRIALEGGSGVGITDEFGNATAALPNKVPGNIFKVGQLFSIGTEIFTVNVVGTPAIMLTTGTPRITNTFNTDTGEYVFRGAAADTQIYFYPCEPVMGLTFFETNTLNNNPAIAFDTQFAYKFSGTAWDRVGPTSGSYFHGTNYNFFKATNWHGATGDVNMLFVSNFNATYTTPSANDDSMWRYDGTTLTGWTQFAPVVIVGANFVKTAKIILPFKDRLVLLNTIENNGGGGGGTNAAFPNRCRYSHNGSPFAANAFYEPNQVNSDGGGHQDAPTREEIVSAEFIKDRLIVYFEKSTWELASTSNQVKPFTWQKINAELGSESTFSSVPFDKAILTIGTTGVHACNGANVIRIDDDIKEQVFKIRNANNGLIRVAGIRDYFIESVYWAFPVSNSDEYASTYPNQILVYNYKYQTWAIFDDSITAFGYFEQQTGLTWQGSNTTWQESNFSWSSGTVQPQFRQVIAGNQQGYVFNILANISTNEHVMQISDISISGELISLLVVDHNLQPNDYINIENVQGTTGLNGNNYQVIVYSEDIIIIEASGVTGAYKGGGTVSRVSRIDILTKRFNPFLQESLNVAINYVDFGVQKTSDGKILVDYYASSSNLSMVDSGIATASMLGTNVLETSPYTLEPLENLQALLWHRIYIDTQGDNIQLRLFLSDEDMLDTSVTNSDFQLEGMILNAYPTGRIS